MLENTVTDRARVSNDLVVGMRQPTTEDLDALAVEGFRSVVDLREEGERGQRLAPEEEGTAVERRGMCYRHVPVPVDRLDDDRLNRVHRELAHVPKPAFVHCASGKRSGTLALMHEGLTRGWSGQQVVDRAEQMGMAYGSADVKDAIRHFVDRYAKPP
ncbi:MAG TPA: sulfur transferase domain-containing protein [Azospirillum sp.]|nr:sulfur transferase domain-containing protein [Azospirillum sp.]